MRILVTGGAGFIGHHFIEHLLKNTDWDIVVLDKLNYASDGFNRLRDIDCFNIARVLLLSADFTKKLEPGIVQEIGEVGYIVHMGAETHVDKSIENAEPFVMSNVVGTMHMLEFARTLPNLQKFIMFSTDEVYGPAPIGTAFRETDRYNSTNPYAGTKAGAEQLALAYENTYKVPVFVTNTMNVFGARQHPEKFIPLCMTKILNGETIKIHSDKTLTVSGSRFWIHARNVAHAIMFLLENGVERESYNIVGNQETSNLEVATMIARILGKELKYEMIDFHSTRPGHDLRYALDGTKLANMNFVFPKSFEDSFEENIKWHLRPENKRWLVL